MANNWRDLIALLKKAIELFERIAVVLAAIVLVLIVVIYMELPKFEPPLTEAWRVFLQGVIINLVPTLLVFVLAYVLFYRQIQKLRSEQEAEVLANSIADHLATQIRRTIVTLRDLVPAAKFAWLYSAGDILAVEGEIKAEEIWIVSPHLLNDAGDFDANPGPESTVATVQKNLRRRVKYTFIVPDTDKIRTLLPRLKQNYETHGGQLRIITLSLATFESLAFSEIAIYNPRMKGRNPSRVFLELPISIAHAWWAELSDETAYALIERIRQIVDKVAAA